MSGSIGEDIDGAGGGTGVDGLAGVGDSDALLDAVAFVGVDCGSVTVGIIGCLIKVSCPFCSCTKNFMCALGKLVSPTSDL